MPSPCALAGVWPWRYYCWALPVSRECLLLLASSRLLLRSFLFHPSLTTRGALLLLWATVIQYILPNQEGSTIDGSQTLQSHVLRVATDDFDSPSPVVAIHLLCLWRSSIGLSDSISGLARQGVRRPAGQTNR